MNRRLMQFIWQQKLLDLCDLRTLKGEGIKVVKVGFLNHLDGSHFGEARLSIDGLDWVGSVAMHPNDSQWVAPHPKAASDQAVILHVVWELTGDVSPPDGVPCLVLKPYISQKLLNNYTRLMDSNSSLPCAYGLDGLESIQKISVLEDKVYARLRRKSKVWLAVLDGFGHNWQQLFFYLLAIALGKKANQKAMSVLADKLKFDDLAKHSDSQLVMEAMILGTAGLLDSDEERCRALKKEFQFWQAKYQLKPMTGLEWDFSQTRGSGKPYLALSILASCVSMLHQVPDLKYLNRRDLTLLKVADYWQVFNSFGQKSARKHGVSNQLIHHLEINVVVPFLGVLGAYYQQDEYFQQAYSILETKPVEHNSIVKKLVAHGFQLTNASCSQGAIELYNEYCLKKQCLDCRIGQLLIQA